MADDLDLVTLEIEAHGGCVVARLEGEIDLSNASHVERRFSDDALVGAGNLVVDLSGLRYLDSAGVAFLHRLARARIEEGRTLAIVVTEDSFIRKVLEVTRIDAVAPVVDSVEAALVRQ